MSSNTIISLKNGEFDDSIRATYCCSIDEAKLYTERFLNIIDGYNKTFGAESDFRLFSAPGRTEICGNHTDHQHGNVLCGSVNLDVISAVSLNSSNEIRIKSEGYPIDIININDLSINCEEYNLSISLIRGIASRFTQLGFKIGGFNAYTTSNVLKGSGLSSSAAFEVLVGNIFNSLFAENEVSPVDIAKFGQYAENVYFGKPCGLMDQMASAVGGVIAIDFYDAEKPVVEKIDLSLNGYALCIIDSGADHADLTDEYGAITGEMKSVANFFNKSYLREVHENDFFSNLTEVRSATSDRAVLRAIHYFNENKRVSELIDALRDNNIEAFIKLIIESGHSSFMYLQNVFATSQPQHQAVSLALALCEKLLKGKGAYRVHGGGFAGTVQAFVPLEMLEEFKNEIEKFIGDAMCHILSIRPVGGCEIKRNSELSYYYYG